MDALQKTATMERLVFTLESFNLLYENTQDPQFLHIMAECHREISLIQDLPDDDFFMSRRCEILERNGLL